MSLILNHDAIYRARALEILKRRIYGATLQEIADEFQCSKQTVRESLDFVKREKLVESYERSILNLVPEAIKVYEEKLTNEKDPFVAKDVIDKLVKLGDRFAQQTQHKQNIGLAAYLAKAREAKAAQAKANKDVVIDVRAESAGNTGTDSTAGVEDGTSASLEGFFEDDGFPSSEQVSGLITSGSSSDEPADGSGGQ